MYWSKYLCDSCSVWTLIALQLSSRGAVAVRLTKCLNQTSPQNILIQIQWIMWVASGQVHSPILVFSA